MKKKQMKKLTLDRETLRLLEESRLGQARGAVSNNTCDVSGCIECYPASLDFDCVH